MSNLLISVIAITLTGLAAVTSIYYGGSYYENGQIRAAATGLVTTGLQVSTAFRSITNDHGYQPPTSWAMMINGGYLTGIPQSTQFA